MIGVMFLTQKPADSKTGHIKVTGVFTAETRIK
jgi:hypothetical protein